jgi:hypothetical protein
LRPPARATAVLAAVVAGVVAMVLIVSSMGSSKGSGAAHSATSGSVHALRGHGRLRGGASSRAAAHGTGRTYVVVLNGTGVTGLAHQVSGQLHQSGYSQATALAGRPAGTNQVTVVEYTGGHRADAQGVARSLGLTRTQPIEASVASLSGSAPVVVVVGADRASSAGGGESPGGAATASR